MTRNELIAAVALDFIKKHMEREPEGTLRFCMLGLESSLVCSIANAVAVDESIKSEVLIKVSSTFNSSGELGPELISNESITHWRHCRLDGPIRAVLFAATQDELQRNDKSVEKVTKIETDTLRACYQTWADSAGLTKEHLTPSKREHLLTALESTNVSHAARTIETFADFVIAIAQAVDKGLPLQKALDEALPSLKLPRYSANFDRIPEKRRNSISEWNKVFRKINTKIRPLLVRETESGEAIPTEQLKTNYAEMLERLEQPERVIIENFLDADLRIDHWTAPLKALVELDWRTISDLFEGVTKSEPLSLGQKTVKFFDDEFEDQLEEYERELLSASFPKNPTDDLESFFETHREHLARDKKLSSAWEKYIFRNPKTYDDFWVGLIDTLDSLRRRVNDDELSDRKLSIIIPGASKKSFWRNKNPKVARYFAYRYQGIEKLFGDEVQFDFGKLGDFYFSEFDEDLAKVTTASKDARTLKFEVVLDPHGANAKLIFYWEMAVDAIATALPDDLISIANLKESNALLSSAEITRQSVSSKGTIQRVDLADINTIRDVANTNEGKLVAPNDPNCDRGEAFISALREISEVTGVNKADFETIRKHFDTFCLSYTAAIRDWISDEGAGLSSKYLVEQAEAYGLLLDGLSRHANNDLAREKLWQDVLRIGVANIGVGASAAIITPWHPLRLAEIAIKAKQTAKLIKETLKANEEDIFRADLLFAQREMELSSNFYPEICIGFDDDRPILLAIADKKYDYTLAEPPLRNADGTGENTLDVEPTVAAKAFSKVGEQYLTLLPHERSNFSMVLFNAESKALPSALASELSSKVEQENELQCDLLLTHSNPRTIRRVYEQQNVNVSEESGSVMASEAARNFLSRLRVGFLDAADLPEDDSYRVADIVALQDVVARNAKLVWKRAPGERSPEFSEHVPVRWSRRRPVALTDTSAAVYLACPSQPQACQSYLNLVHGYLDGDNALNEDVIPAREVTFRDGNIAEVLRQTHKLGEWVVNFDELVDRRILSNNGVSVIRHIHDRRYDRNVVVSTTSNPMLLKVLLKERVDKLDPTITQLDSKVITRLIERANDLSGQVVMRAARYGHFANELLGVVLSMEQIRSLLGGNDLPFGWYCLDDFASWFGQREEQIADIMVIAPRLVDDKPILKVAISEAKFVASNGYRSQAKKSAKQLEETIARLSRALDPQHRRIDRQIWLNCLGDFMIEGMEPFGPEKINGWDLHKWSDEVRQDRVPIEVVGFSHVFIHDDDERVDAGEPTPLKGMSHCTQQIFDKPQVAALMRAFASNEAVASNEHSAIWPEALVSSETKFSPPSGEESGSDVEQTRSSQDDIPTGGESSELQGSEVEPEKEVTTHETQDSSPQVKDTADNDEAEQHIPAELLTQWPSRQLAEWVNGGSLSDEEDEETRAWLDATVIALQRALRGYDMTAELIGSRLTPNAALVRFRGSDDLTVPKVEKKQQELLTSHAIDVINVLAAPMEVVIMVARPVRAILRLKDLWKQRQLPDTAPESNTSLLLGACESNGELLYLNVSEGFGGFQGHGPHTLIAGESGSGKGVLVQSLLLDICATNSPASARIRMIDPKSGVDYPWLRNMPHLDGSLITEQNEAIEALEELVGEMERRNKLLAEAGVTKLENYNKKVAPSERLPRIWLFHDEMADWMMIKEYRDAVELHVSRLGVKARAAGINMVLITQRPDKDALPMQLRANLTNRLVLKVADKRNSILVMDEPGAERLLGKGHLAAKLSGESRIILSQVPFADEEQIMEVAKLVQKAHTN